MKLLRYGPAGQEKPGLLDDSGTIRDLSGQIDDVAGDVLLPESLARLKALDPASLPAVEGDPRIGPCVGRVGKFQAIGLNYADHAKESGVPIPEEPVVFTKATSSICGPNDDTITPRGSTKLDYEVELGLVIGKPGVYIEESAALDHVAGFCVVNDVSERLFQLEGTGQWTKGKSADTFGPIGPWLVTPDEAGDPQALDIWLEVDGQRRQDGNTRTMIFPVVHIVSYLSRFMSLQSGDVITTGTPPGVGAGMTPPGFVTPGQEVRLGIAGLGEQRQTIVGPI